LLDLDIDGRNVEEARCEFVDWIHWPGVCTDSNEASCPIKGAPPPQLSDYQLLKEDPFPLNLLLRITLDTAGRLFGIKRDKVMFWG
jgi:hypothetical protein